MINTDYQGEIGLSFQSEGMNEYIWSAGDLLLHFWVRSYPMMKAIWKRQQINPGRTSEVSDPSRMRVWLMPTGKHPQAFAEFGVNMKSVVGEGSYKYQLRPCDQWQEWIL